MTGTPQNKHLEKIEDDQSINGIDRVELSVRNDAGRKWFISQAITPIVETGTYDSSTGLILLKHVGMVISVEDTSQAAHTITVPHGQIWQFLGCGGSDTSRNCLFRYEYSDDGGTNWFPVPSTAPGVSITAGGSFHAVSDFVVIGSGTLRQVRIINATFVAADPSRYTITYRVLRT